MYIFSQKLNFLFMYFFFVADGNMFFMRSIFFQVKTYYDHKRKFQLKKNHY